MKLSTKLTQFLIDYPALENIPKNLLNTPTGKKFNPQSGKLIPFREQYANEAFPHKIRHCDYQFGTINKRRAIKFYHRKDPVKLVYSNQSDPFAKKLMAKSPPRTSFPATTVTSPIARSLREYALKWITDQFFSKLNYLTFDEPIVDGVNPDCLVVLASKAHQILHLNDTLSANSNTPKDKENSGSKGVEITDAMFVEIKAYHGSTLVGEKEVLQSFNYATKGGKTLLLTTGKLGDLKALDIINDAPENPNYDYSQGYEPDVYAAFSQEVKRKNRALIKRIDMAASQDSFDTRGIYISASTKIKKAYKYTKNWPRKVEYTILSSSDHIMEFLTSADHQGLGLVESAAFVELLRQFKLESAATLFENVRDRYLEEIVMDPTLLYPH
ncbi:MAG: hypothetical protein ACTSWW_08655 [Promethearchaeota archaeon]